MSEIERLMVTDNPLIGTIKQDVINGGRRIVVAAEETGGKFGHDCTMDAVVSLALRKQGIDPGTLQVGQRLAVSVRVLDAPVPAVTFHHDDYVPRERA